MGTTTRPQRVATPQRWQAALKRALGGNVQVRQLNTSGAWVATSSTDPALAYTLEVVAGVARSCTCEAGQHGDPICCHRAMYYHRAGMLDVEEGPCPACAGEGAGAKESKLFPGTRYRVTCAACGGRGVVRDRPRPAA